VAIEICWICSEGIVVQLLSATGNDLEVKDTLPRGPFKSNLRTMYEGEKLTFSATLSGVAGFCELA